MSPGILLTVSLVLLQVMRAITYLSRNGDFRSHLSGLNLLGNPTSWIDLLP